MHYPYNQSICQNSDELLQWHAFDQSACIFSKTTPAKGAEAYVAGMSERRGKERKEKEKERKEGKEKREKKEKERNGINFNVWSTQGPQLFGDAPSEKRSFSLTEWAIEVIDSNTTKDPNAAAMRRTPSSAN
eukprot:scaffold103379_cov19-Prasinocladus_malaysianus.AAC.1